MKLKLNAFKGDAEDPFMRTVASDWPLTQELGVNSGGVGCRDDQEVPFHVRRTAADKLHLTWWHIYGGYSVCSRPGGGGGWGNSPVLQISHQGPGRLKVPLNDMPPGVV